MRLVITEKPSVALSIAKVLGAHDRHNGYVQGGGYIVSWCVGHLLELADTGAYGKQFVKWRYDTLPILPTDWKYSVKEATKQQLDVLCRLMKDKNVDRIVCATDAGREGELMIRQPLTGLPPRAADRPPPSPKLKSKTRRFSRPSYMT